MKYPNYLNRFNSSFYERLQVGFRKKLHFKKFCCITDRFLSIISTHIEKEITVPFCALLRGRSLETPRNNCWYLQNCRIWIPYKRKEEEEEEMKILFEIGPKQIGNWNIPVNIRITFPNTELNPYFILQNYYKFPGPIIVGKKNNLRFPSYSTYQLFRYSSYDYCMIINDFIFNLSTYIEKEITFPLCIIMKENNLIKYIERAYCPNFDPENCRIWIPSKFEENITYLNYIEVFDKIFEDMISAWKSSIDKALENEDIKLDSTLIDSNYGYYKNINHKEDDSEKHISRKIIISELKNKSKRKIA